MRCTCLLLTQSGHQHPLPLPPTLLSFHTALGGSYVRRRDFIKVAIAGSAVAWPLATRAQQPPTPVIGFLRPTRAEESGQLVAAVREGLRESGYPTDKAVIESRWGDGHEERLPKLAVELVGLQVAAIVAGSLPSARAAKAATASIPIIFVTGADPQTEGLVSSISRPGGNMISAPSLPSQPTSTHTTGSLSGRGSRFPGAVRPLA